MISAAGVVTLKPNVERVTHTFWTLHDLKQPSDYSTTSILQQKKHVLDIRHQIPCLELSRCQQKLSEEFAALLQVLLSRFAQVPAQFKS